jgi:hypothetical protein
MCYENELQYGAAQQQQQQNQHQQQQNQQQRAQHSTSQVISQSAHSVVNAFSNVHHQPGPSAPAGGFQSAIEQALLNAKNPVDINSTETITAGQYRGIYLNKQEVDQFRSPVPIEQYRLNDDPNPEVIKKRLDKVRYTQECGVKYLNPPPAPKPGDIIIRERQTNIPPAPPLIVFF